MLPSDVKIGEKYLWTFRSNLPREVTVTARATDNNALFRIQTSPTGITYAYASELTPIPSLSKSNDDVRAFVEQIGRELENLQTKYEEDQEKIITRLRDYLSRG